MGPSLSSLASAANNNNNNNNGPLMSGVVIGGLRNRPLPIISKQNSNDSSVGVNNYGMK